jgi:protein gp37
MTSIQWTEKAWNPLGGCMVVSPGCALCYAMRDAYRMSFNPLTPSYRGLTHKVHGRAVWTGAVARAADDKFYAPLGWKRPRMVFVNSMSDLFFERFPEQWIDDVFRVIELRPQHTYQILTKRAERMRDYCRNRVPPRQCWLGVSVEDHRHAEERLPVLIATPAAGRWASDEPLFEAVDLSLWLYALDWIVVGGESGPGARPFDLAWARRPGGVPRIWSPVLREANGIEPGRRRRAACARRSQGRGSDGVAARAPRPRMANSPDGGSCVMSAYFLYQTL